MLIMSLSTYGRPTGDAGLQQTYVQAQGLKLIRVYINPLNPKLNPICYFWHY